MAIQTITPVQLVKNSATSNIVPSGGTAIVAADTFRIKYPQEGKLLLMFNNTFAGAKVFTVNPGSFPYSVQGKLDVSLAQNDVKYLIVSTDRFVDNDGYVNITFEAGTTGFVRAFYLP